MVRREADGSRIVADPVEAEGLRIPNQDAEDAASAGQAADPRVLFGVDAGREEPFELVARFVDHAEGRIPRVRQGGRGLDEFLEQRVE